MSAFHIKTPSEQKLEWLESIKRPLTDEESVELQRAMHAVYCQHRKARMLGKARQEELKLLKKVLAEASQPEWHTER